MIINQSQRDIYEFNVTPIKCASTDIIDCNVNEKLIIPRTEDDNFNLYVILVNNGSSIFSIKLKHLALTLLRIFTSMYERMNECMYACN